MLTSPRRFIALLLILMVVFSQSVISAAGESYNFSDQEVYDMADVSNDNVLPSDAANANFRNVKAGRIGRYNLFRSQHPANGTSGSFSANKLAKKNAIATVLNLSDSDLKLKANFETHQLAPTYYYRTLYAKGNVYLANMRGTYVEKVYRKKIVECMRFMIRKRGPYLVHCEIGRDRTAYVILLIESLMGASYTYMFKDYAQSYISRDGMTYEQARNVSLPLINEIMHNITGKPKNTGWGSLNLSYYAELYLKKGGMSPAELNTLKRNLSMNNPEDGIYYDLCYVPKEWKIPETVPADSSAYENASETAKKESAAEEAEKTEEAEKAEE